MSDPRTTHDAGDCWNRIGVHGDRSCERLDEHGHCRHCDIHASTAARMMQRSVPPEYREAWTQHFAEPEPAARAANESALVFRIDQEWLALPARHAVTIAEHDTPHRLHRLPHRQPGELQGIMNVKGRLYPCMSMSFLLRAGEPAPAVHGERAQARILVADLGGVRYAIPVQEVHGIHRYSNDELQAVPPALSPQAQRYLRGILDVGGKVAGCLDAELLGQQFAGALK